MKYAENYSDLKVYAKVRVLAKRVFDLTRSFPKEEMYSLTDQVRRSSRSIEAQIAEAWAKRRYEKHFVSKLTDADGETMETIHWVETAADCGYLDTATRSSLVAELSEVSKMLNGMIHKSNLFCLDKKKEYYISEHHETYFVNKD